MEIPSELAEALRAHPEFLSCEFERAFAFLADSTKGDQLDGLLYTTATAIELGVGEAIRSAKSIRASLLRDQALKLVVEFGFEESRALAAVRILQAAARPAKSGVTLEPAILTGRLGNSAIWPTLQELFLLIHHVYGSEPPLSLLRISEDLGVQPAPELPLQAIRFALWTREAPYFAASRITASLESKWIAWISSRTGACHGLSKRAVLARVLTKEHAQPPSDFQSLTGAQIEREWHEAISRATDAWEWAQFSAQTVGTNLQSYRRHAARGNRFALAAILLHAMKKPGHGMVLDAWKHGMARCATVVPNFEACLHLQRARHANMESPPRNALAYQLLLESMLAVR